jgi:hypothetical protein
MLLRLPFEGAGSSPAFGLPPRYRCRSNHKGKECYQHQRQAPVRLRRSRRSSFHSEQSESTFGLNRPFCRPLLPPNSSHNGIEYGYSIIFHINRQAVNEALCALTHACQIRFYLEYLQRPLALTRSVAIRAFELIGGCGN